MTAPIVESPKRPGPEQRPPRRLPEWMRRMQAGRPAQGEGPHRPSGAVIHSAPNTAICGATHDVTADAGAWDVGTCHRPPRLHHDHPTTVDPQSGEDYCPTCHRHLAAHVDDRCPDEAEAVATWGRS